LLCSSVWSQTWNPPASTSQVLGLWACATTFSYYCTLQWVNLIEGCFILHSLRYFIHQSPHIGVSSGASDSILQCKCSQVALSHSCSQ
jgi:hypothetical protein